MKKVLLVMALAIACLVSCKEKNTDDMMLEALRSSEVIDTTKAALLPEEVNATEECDKIMGALADNDMHKAFAYMEKIFPLPAEEFNELREKTIKMLEASRPRYGKIIGYEKVSVRKKSDSVLVANYILKLENIALRWRFAFYKPKDKWFLNNMTWDDKFSED